MPWFVVKNGIVLYIVPVPRSSHRVRINHLGLYVLLLIEFRHPASITGVGGWEHALALANTFLAQLTLEEKTRIVTGTTGPYVVTYT